MEAQHGRTFSGRRASGIGKKQPGWHTVTGLGGEREFLTGEAGLLAGCNNLDIKRNAALAAGEDPGDVLKMRDDVFSPNVPIRECLDRTFATEPIANDHELGMVGIERGLFEG
jgi:hypothetical protein